MNTSKTPEPILVDLGYSVVARIMPEHNVGKLERKIEAELTIMAPSGGSEEGGYSPPESVCVVGNENLRKLHRALGRALGIQSSDKKRSHHGDSCKYCGTSHDDVKPGLCPGL